MRSGTTNSIFGLVLVAWLCSAVTVANKVKVDVYYETLCPDSIRYLTSVVLPTMKTDLGSRIDLTLYPFGKATMKMSNDVYTFECHHGPEECYGNKIHACALKEIQSAGDNRQLDLIDCLMSNRDYKNYERAKLEPCFNKNGLTLADMDKVQMCANSTEGSKLLADYGSKTNLVQNPLKSVPFTVFNQKMDEEASKRAYNGNLASIVCMHLPGENQPAACLNANGTAITDRLPSIRLTAMSTLLAATTALLAAGIATY